MHRKKFIKNVASGVAGMSLVRPAHLSNLSYRAGSIQLLFSPEYEIITNDTNAQSLAEGYHRKGFEIPDVV
jgi:hypothetical protein